MTNRPKILGYKQTPSSCMVLYGEIAIVPLLSTVLEAASNTLPSFTNRVKQQPRLLLAMASLLLAVARYSQFYYLDRKNKKC